MVNTNCNRMGSVAVAKETSLTKEECKLREVLSKVSTDSFWGAAIRVALAKQSNRVFRELIAALKSQMNDSPEIMKRIIGVAGCECLIECKDAQGT
jgi:hypothetical protein